VLYAVTLGRARWGSADGLATRLLTERTSRLARCHKSNRGPVRSPPIYVSLQSALFRHGLIEQVPDVLYAITLGRARRVRTPSGTVSLHRMPPALFGGYETTDDGTKVATAEKALFDLLFLSPTRTRLFVHLPEIEFPKSFRWAEVGSWTKKIAGKSRRAFVEQKLAALRNVQSRVET
jgi:hypothetical protein